MTEPTIGRIVIARNVMSNNGATEAPAIITRVWSRATENSWCVNAKILKDSPDCEWATSIYLFDTEEAAADYYAANAAAGHPAGRHLVWPPRA